MAKTVLQSIKAKIIDKTSDVLSLPARMKANRVVRQANQDADVLKMDRMIPKGPVPGAQDYTNPLFRTRVMANDVRYRRTGN